MQYWEKALIPQDTSIFSSLALLDQTALQLLIVVDSQRRLLGTVTDGDIRRAILKSVDLQSPIKEIMHTDCTVGHQQDSQASTLLLMKKKSIKQLPVVNTEGQVVGIRQLLDIVDTPIPRNNPVVLMAGGRGERLRPLTDDCPKPLLRIGGKPILETILQGFIEHGFSNFYISVNYKAEMIEDYFQDGTRWGITINYLRETKQLGTAGCLSLFPEPPQTNFLVMNGDLLTRINYSELLKFHDSNRSQATMGIREYTIEIPYGVVETNGHQLIGLREKPTHQFFVNSGVYAFSPDILKLLKNEEYLDMPALFERSIQHGYSTCVFPIHEYWMDIGRMGDYVRADDEFERHFECSSTRQGILE